MIQVYQPDNTEYNKNGDMTLFPSEAVVEANLNGEWTASLTHPIDSVGRWKYLTDQAVIKMPSFNGEQLFRIIQKTKSESAVTVTAEPVFLDARDDCFLPDVRPTNKTGQQALDYLLSGNDKYTAKSDITTASTAYYVEKNLIEALLSDEDQSFLNRWGGEVLFDNYRIIINQKVGGDYGVTLLYGKNIKEDGIEEKVDFSEVVTRIYPKGYNGYAMGSFVDSPLIGAYPTVKTRVMKFDDVKMREDVREDEEGVIVCETEAEFNAALKKKCDEQYAQGIDRPVVEITVDMVLLQNTTAYEDYKPLETVSLGDTVHLKHSRLGIVTDARVVSLQYDAIREKARTVTIGAKSANLFDRLSSTVTRVESAVRPDGSIIAEQVQGFLNATETQMRAQNSVTKRQDVRAILFEDTDPASAMFGALSIGTQGIQIAHERTDDGRDWKWETALTAQGLVASIIVTGILSDKASKNRWNLETGEFRLSADFQIGEEDEDAQQTIFDKLTHNGDAKGIYMTGDGQLYFNFDYARGGTLILGGLNNTNGVLEVRDASNTKVGGMDKDGLFAIAGRIGGWTINGHKIYGGDGSTGTAVMQMPASDTTWVFAAGGKSHDAYADSPFRVHKNGTLYATNANISGTVNATSGKFSNITLDGVTLQNNNTLSGTLSGGTYSSGLYSGGSLSSVGGTYTGTCSGSTLSSCDLGGTSLATGNGGYISSDGQNNIVIDGDIYVHINAGGAPKIQTATIYSTTLYGNVIVTGKVTATNIGSISKAASYGTRVTDVTLAPSPTVTDAGWGTLNDSGECEIIIDPVMAELVDETYMPHAQLTKYGAGDVYVDPDRSTHDVIVVRGTPGLRFAWEVRYRQGGTISERFAMPETLEDSTGEPGYNSMIMEEYYHSRRDYAAEGAERLNLSKRADDGYNTVAASFLEAESRMELQRVEDALDLIAV